MGKKGPGSKLEIGLALPDVGGDKIKITAVRRHCTNWYEI